MMTAVQARALSFNSTYSKDDFIELHSVLSLVRVFAVMGDTRLITDCAISESVQFELEELGFEVYDEDNMSIIGWD